MGKPKANIFDKLNSKIKLLKIRINPISEYLERTSELTSINMSEVKCKLELVDSMYCQFEEAIADFQNKADTEFENGDLESLILDFENCVQIIKTQLMSIRDNQSIPNQIKKSVSDIIDVRIPEIYIPTFDGKPNEWLTFKQTFESVVHNNLSLQNSITKFNLLLKYLKGDARAAIGHIDLTHNGYIKAWEELNKRFHNKKLLIDVHIDGLLNLPTVVKGNSQELKDLLNKAIGHTSSLEACEQNIEQLGELFVINCITRKLNYNLRRDWESECVTNVVPTWLKLNKFLIEKSRIFDIVQPSNSTKFQVSTQSSKFNSQKSNIPNNFKTNSNTPFRSSAFVNSNSQQPGPSFSRTSNNNSFSNCVICKLPFHRFSECSKFLEMSTHDRYEKVKQLNLCLNCFSSKHFTSKCLNRCCRTCSQKHNTLLHHSNSSNLFAAVEKNPTPPISNSIVTPNTLLDDNQTNQNNNFCALQKNSCKITFLSTAIILIKDKFGKTHEARALLDSGSQSNFISASFANKFHFSKFQTKQFSVSGLNENPTIINEQINSEISSKASSYKVSCNFLIVDNISNALPHTPINISRWNIPSNIRLADPFFNLPRPIDILLGAQIFFHVVKEQRIHLNYNLPILIDTIFGFIVSGNYEPNNVQTFYTVSDSGNKDKMLQESIKKIFELESVSNENILSKDEKACESHYSRTTYRDSENRYVVSLPLSSNVLNLGDSKTQALKRFNYLEQRLNSNPDIKSQYFQFMNEYLRQKHMKITEEKLDDPNTISYYMPHHAILKPSSSTTKLRVVFDASAKSSTNISLNDAMLVGPSVQQDLFKIILRFRKYRYVFTADICKMYRQISINPSNFKLQRILWRFDKSEPIKTCELKTVTYGTASAPYLATRTLIQLAHDERQKFPTAASVLENDFYVDDVLTGANSLSEIITLKNELIDLLRRGNFELHKWSSNCPTLLGTISSELHEILHKDETSSQESIKALGIEWKPNEDIFIFKVKNLSNDTSPSTKRTILSDILKIYDPMGLISPIIVTAKVIIQSLWKLNSDWDTPVPKDLNLIWSDFKSQLNHVNELRIPRCIINSQPVSIELHGFSDASEKAYGACFYIKSIDKFQNVYVSLLCSKSRISPLKTLTIPRLELCAAYLLSKLLNSVLQSLNIKFDKICLWSDSMIVLHWIKMSPHLLKMFVANRVNQIQEATETYSWQYVNTHNNPADIISRGLMPNELKENGVWFNGPDFLRNTELIPLISNTSFNSDLLELKSKEPINNFFHQNIDSSFLFRYSSYQKLIRIISYCKRFFKNCQSKVNDKPCLTQTETLTLEELDEALITIVKIIQFEHFKSEICSINKIGKVSDKSHIQNLTPFLDKNQILRVGGRIKNANIPYDAKHQILLPKNHYFTKLILRHEHIKNLHVGPTLLVSIVRQKFWPINVANTAKSICRSCIQCFKFKPIISQQIMGNLPTDRVSPAKPFNTTGIDLCGPFNIKNKLVRNSPLVKVFIALFICFATKAIHLELVSDLSADTFINCLKRFLHRRGKCSVIWTDNAGNFIGCNNELRRMFKLFQNTTPDNRIINFCANEQIQWKFIPPRSPNFGGLWESNIKSVKRHIKKLALNITLSYEEMNTLIIQIEGIINSRPLTKISNDPNEPEPLTPAHFLTGGSIASPLEPSLLLIPQNRLSNWQQVTQLTQSFWRRYSIEYLHTLQQKSKWKSSLPNIQIDDIVMLLDDNLPSTKWLMGIVIKVYPGQDDKVRVVDVRTKSGIFKRAISKLSKLPMSNE